MIKDDFHLMLIELISHDVSGVGSDLFKFDIRALNDGLPSFEFVVDNLCELRGRFAVNTSPASAGNCANRFGTCAI